MNLKFDTERLLVEWVLGADSVPPEKLTEILTDRTTEYLPAEWQGIVDSDKAVEWLKDRLNEGGIYSLSLKSNTALVGFLFLYGLDGASGSGEVRIGYVISEKHWGEGLITELIRSTIKRLKNSGNVSVLLGGVSKENVGSIRVLTKNGFSFGYTEGGTDFYAYVF